MAAHSSTYFDTNLWNRLTDSLLYFKNLIKENSPLKTFGANSKSNVNLEDGLNPNRLFFSLPSNDSNAMRGGEGALMKSISASKQFLTDNQRQIVSLLSKLLGVSVSAITTYFLLKWLMKTLDPTNADKLSAKTRAEKIMKQIGIRDVDLNEYELLIASNIVLPHNIDCSWQDIGGLEHIIEDLRETVIYPLKNFELYQSSNANGLIHKRSRLIQPPKGVLLFGVS
jgi:ATP-dependent 26S proteasome regulatory subunit